MNSGSMAAHLVARAGCLGLLAEAAGRLRPLVKMLVRTKPGHSTLTPTAEPSAASSAARVSLRATTPCLVTQYGPSPGATASPASDAVFTRWPPSPASSSGRNEWMP